MRPADTLARERLPVLMSRQGPSRAADLAQALGVSLATLHRLLQERADVHSAGRARRSRHALQRRLRGVDSHFPVVRIDTEGRAHDAGSLVLVQPEGCAWTLEASPWPVPDESRDGWWPGLPYPLQDMRPQGYLGRQLARQGHAAWQVADDPTRWSDDDALHVLSLAGDDCSGNLIVGEAAFRRWQAAAQRPADPLPARGLAKAYAALAEQAVALGVAGSSAAGEFPKFPALREASGAPDPASFVPQTPHVLVKFSGAGGSGAEQRWADLLVCEHLALQAMARLPGLPGLQGARSRVLQAGGRCFLEVERFDRHGGLGRSALVSLATLDAAFVGLGRAPWPQLAQRLLALGLIDAATLHAIEQLHWFGQLIANTDMHLGNLSFRPQADASGGPALALAPVYDMLPMAYAPLPGGEVAQRAFVPPLPVPAQRPAWLGAARAAIDFWRSAGQDPRIGEAMRAIALANAQAIETAAERV